MDGTAVVLIMKEIESLKNTVKELNQEMATMKKQLQPVLAREERLQKEEEYDKKYPCGWGYTDDTKTTIWTG